MIIGAGPSGLAMGACLTRRNVPHLIVERAPQVGAAWRNHYDRLHLHTVKSHSNLPFLSFPKHVEKYPSRQAVVDYLETYARHFGLQPQLGEEVLSVRSDNGGWVTETNTRQYRSVRVVVASGYNRRPVVPTWPGSDAFPGAMIHSAEYRNGAPFTGKRVLVVGIGNTGGEIAIDLHEHGAASIHLCVRGPVNVIPRDLLGTPAQVSGILLSHLPRRIEYFISRAVSRLAVPDLSQYGLVRPEISPAESINKYGRVPLIDIGTVDLIVRGAIAVVPGIRRFDGAVIEFVNGARVEFDAIILATGYRPGLDDFLPMAHDVTDESGYPIPPAGESERSGLYFLGFSNPTTGFLRQIAIDSRRIAKAIERKRLAGN